MRANIAALIHMVFRSRHEELEITGDTAGRLLERARALDSLQDATVPSGDVEAFLRAGEELGISRSALLQALREEYGHPVAGFGQGDLVYARSSDGFYYVGTVLDKSGGAMTVRFANGGEKTCGPMEMRAFSALPGQKVQANLPLWGWATCELISYDSSGEKVIVSDGIARHRLGLKDIRLAPQKASTDRVAASVLWRVALLAGGAGAILGALVMALFS